MPDPMLGPMLARVRRVTCLVRVFMTTAVWTVIWRTLAMVRRGVWSWAREGRGGALQVRAGGAATPLMAADQQWKGGDADLVLGGNPEAGGNCELGGQSGSW